MARLKLPAFQDQLEQALQMAFAEALDATIDAVRSGRTRKPYFAARDALAERLVSAMVLYCGGDKQVAAKRLGVSHSTIKQFS